ncbi:MAG TPA: PRC-barrel domain-containing protein [Aliidongia sp.]|uniref:PRC-barrel domain-containing protein n=1 Tax=Aliidongia sp. TaxID=1914230 RepID=UPI002DDDA4EC|nr:PRC-barrel domain-containing protein [Aliidongia sp.]HEV2675611.1 PRC-barrel domain-containing protein [Aliidongia sp.]
MNKIIAATGLAVVMAVSAGSSAFAADTMIQANQVRANKIIGSSVYDRQNQDVASVKDLILDKDGKVADVVLSYGSTAGIGGKYVAVPFASLKLNNNRLTLDQTKDQLAAMPQYKLEDKMTGSGEGPVPATGGHATSAPKQ